MYQLVEIVFFARSDWLRNLLFSDSPPVPPSERRQTRVSYDMDNPWLRGKWLPGLVRFAAITNKDISQIIKQAVPEIYEEGDEIWCGSFNR